MDRQLYVLGVDQAKDWTRRVQPLRSELVGFDESQRIQRVFPVPLPDLHGLPFTVGRNDLHRDDLAQGETESTVAADGDANAEALSCIQHIHRVPGQEVVGKPPDLRRASPVERHCEE